MGGRDVGVGVGVSVIYKFVDIYFFVFFSLFVTMLSFCWELQAQSELVSDF